MTLSLALLLAAVAQWLACWLVVVFRPRRHLMFLVSSAVLAVAMFVLAPGSRAARNVIVPGPQRSPTASCAEIKEGMRAAEVRRTIGEPSFVMNEEDTQGPGAEAWLYAETGCVVRLLYGEVRTIDFETAEE